MKTIAAFVVALTLVTFAAAHAAVTSPEVAFGADAPEISVAPDKLKPTYCQNFPEDGTRC